MHKLEDMSLYEASRWISLIQAIDTIDDKCKKKGKDFDKIMISPVDLKKYINNTFETHYINFGHYLDKNGIHLSMERPTDTEDLDHYEEIDNDNIIGDEFI
jgi:hypothetical protein